MIHPYGRHARGLVLLGALAFTLPPSTSVRAQAEAPPTDDAADRAPEGIAYSASVRGLDARPELRDLLNAVAETVQGEAGVDTEAEAPRARSLAALRRQARRDVEAMLGALRSRGYYDAEVEFALAPEGEPRELIFLPEPNTQYTFNDVTIELLDAGATTYTPPSPASLGLDRATPAVSRAILNAEGQLLDDALADGYPRAEAGNRTAIIDRDTQTMDLILRLSAGPRATLGAARYRGLETVKTRYLDSFRTWTPGETRYRPDLLTDYRNELIATGLFARAEVELAAEPAPDGSYPLEVNLTERPHRSIGGGVGFRTDIGPNASVFWENRNFLGAGEELRVEAEGSGAGFALTGRFEKPQFFGRRDQSLVIDAELQRATTEAFESFSFGVGAGVQRRLSEGEVASAGVRLRGLQIEDKVGDEEERTFLLLSFPVGYSLDTSDDLLDPTSGGRLRLSAEPFVDLFGNEPFLKLEGSYSRYLQISEAPWLVLAGRLGGGSIIGTSRSNVPADERFYAGGGGSLRGYAFQLAGPIDDEDDPIGGNSLLETSVELRSRFTESIGAALFVDAGGAFETSYPFEGDLFYGAGVGLRYISPIGPVRLDVAVPLNERDIDDAFQIYISIGQAF